MSESAFNGIVRISSISKPKFLEAYLKTYSVFAYGRPSFVAYYMAQGIDKATEEEARKCRVISFFRAYSEEIEMLPREPFFHKVCHDVNALLNSTTWDNSAKDNFGIIASIAILFTNPELGLFDLDLPENKSENKITPKLDLFDRDLSENEIAMVENILQNDTTQRLVEALLCKENFLQCHLKYFNKVPQWNPVEIVSITEGWREEQEQLVETSIIDTRYFEYLLENGFLHEETARNSTYWSFICRGPFSGNVAQYAVRLLIDVLDQAREPHHGGLIWNGLKYHQSNPAKTLDVALDELPLYSAERLAKITIDQVLQGTLAFDIPENTLHKAFGKIYHISEDVLGKYLGDKSYTELSRDYGISLDDLRKIFPRQSDQQSAIVEQPFSQEQKLKYDKYMIEKRDFEQAIQRAHQQYNGTICDLCFNATTLEKGDILNILYKSLHPEEAHCFASLLGLETTELN